MNKVNIEGMDGRYKKLYIELWKDFDFEQINASIKPTYSTQYNKESSNSFCFCDGGNKRETLEDIFQISNRKLFYKKYNMAVSGSGDEEKKITTLHSSSLCALLHFYNVTEENPLAIAELQTDKHVWKNVAFTKSLFEFKTPVINNPSNMDIILLGKSEDKEIILFLESKFSEYYLYSSTVLHHISNKYRSSDNPYTANIYQNKNFSDMGIEIKKDNDKEFSLCADDSVYLGGIKQMISHYCGIRNFIDGNSAEEQSQASAESEIKNKIEHGAVIILGEILFDYKIGALEVRPHLKCLNSYSEKYIKLARLISKEIQRVNTLEILQKDLGYSLFRSNNYKLEANIRKFYRYE